MEYLSLKDRSNLIKACQGQFVPNIPSPLRTLLSYDVTFLDPRSGDYKTTPLYTIFDYFEMYPDEPCQSAILLDLLRGCPASQEDFDEFRSVGWRKEVVLSQTPNTDYYNFDYFFQLNTSTTFHPLVPDNFEARVKIIKRFQSFKNQFMQYKPILYPRYTHKNMSFSTRRAYEASTNISLEGVPIFGQDDWIRHYHETGERLEGSVEMRQKWYPSGAKPRTYFAQGGTCYEHSRYLQDFFTNLVNIFPPTNHMSRLDPDRLKLVDGGHYLIYDLSSFTSNMAAQRSFCRSLAGFFKGVEVTIFDEVNGLLERDLGEMLEDYYEHCVLHPVLNQDRVPISEKTLQEDYVHERASMLGIYGNLMTCTVAHFLIVAPVLEDPFSEDNTAGDDGAILFFLHTYFTVLIVISLVGTFALDKTFRSDDEGAVCLKRPLVEIHDFGRPSSLHLRDNIVPPNLSMAVSYLHGYNVDPRYTIFYSLEDMPVSSRISVVGKDLLRFLYSAHSMNYSTSLVSGVFHGFRRLVHNVTGVDPLIGGTADGLPYTWPADPSKYEFLVHDPYLVYAWLSTKEAAVFDVRELMGYESGSLKEVGDVVNCNSESWLKMMETLGYLEKEAVQMVLFGPEVVDFLYTLLRRNRDLPPSVYKYTVIRDIPDILVV
jgi:hypothetical protein